LSGIKLIVGLANPGREHKDTRHNAGEWLIEAICDQFNASLKPEVKFHGLHGQTSIHGTSCHLLIPTTYMNLSGQAVRAIASYYKIKPDEILIAHDDVDLAVGDIRLKYDGGDGGHNGLKDVTRHLSTKQYYRMRIGVGRPPAGHDTADYVLKVTPKAERQRIDNAIASGIDALSYLLDGQPQKAMQFLHTSD